MLKTLTVVLALAAAALPVAGRAAEGSEQYRLLFREGTLDALEPHTTLLYRRDVTNTLRPETASRDSGAVALSLPGGDPPEAALEFRQGGKHRNLGSFPASVGNPMIMYFYETVVRDMAESSGGSPFYIRNRVKDALVRPAEIASGEAVVDGRRVPTRIVVMRPFADDPNRDRMQGFAGLEMEVVMSEAVPGWYLSLTARAAGAGGTVYRSELRFDGMEAGR